MAIEDLDLEFEDESEKEKSDALEVDVDLSFSAHEDDASGDVIPEPTPIAQNPNHTVEIKPDQMLGSNTSKTNTKNVSEDEVTDPNLRVPKELQKSPTPKDSAAPREIKQQSAPKKDASSEQNVSDISEARKKAAQAAQAAQAAKVKAQAKPLEQEKPKAQQEVLPNVSTPSVNPTPSDQTGAVNEVLLKELSYYREQVEKLRSDMDGMREELYQAKKDSEIKIAVAQMKAELSVELLTNGQSMEQKVNQMLQRIVKKVPQLKGEAVTIKKAVQEYMEVIKKSSK